MTELSTQEKRIVQLEKKLGPSMVDDLRSLSIEGLEKKLMELAKAFGEIEVMRREDEALQAVIKKKKDLDAPYSEQKSWNKIRSEFIYLLLKEKLEGR